jgi:hypothetical protein
MKGQMKGSIGVTDNDWFAFLFTAAIFTENCFEQKSVNLLSPHLLSISH